MKRSLYNPLKTGILPRVGLTTLAATLALLVAGCSDGSAQVNANPDPADGSDLRRGGVFAMSNAADANEIVAYTRSDDGALSQVGFYPTGGSGSGSFEDSANALVLGTMAGEIAPNNLLESDDTTQQLLFAANAGSNSLSVLRVDAGGLANVMTIDTGGEKPVSVSVNNNLVYVLNSGETNDSLFDGDGNVIANCTTGFTPTITGFRLAPDATLTPIAGAERELSGEAVSGCAQLSFTPDGSRLVVTERLAQPAELDQQTNDNERLDDEGVIVVFEVNADGTLGAKQIVDATGQGPFGFTLARNGNLLTTEQFDGPGGPGRGAAASYVMNDDNQGPLLRASPSFSNGGTDTCWFVLSDDQTLGFTSSFFGNGRISSYEVDDIGIVRLIQAEAGAAENDNVVMGASDLSLSGNSEFLYQLNSVNGTINAFRNNGDGTLTLIEQETPFPQIAFGPGGGEAGPIGLAAN